MQRAGLFVCFFDPVLEAHLQRAKAALREFKLDRIFFLPCMFKGASPVLPDGEDKTEMCKRALENETRMEAGASFRTFSELSLLFEHYVQRYEGCEFVCLMEDSVAERLSQKKNERLFPKDLPIRLVGNASGAGRGKPAPVREDAGGMFPGFSFAPEEKTEKRRIRQCICPEGIPAGELAYIAEKGLYLPDHVQEVRSMISAHRWTHTLGVRATAVRLASRFGVNMLKASLAAFYHDCAKDQNIKDMRRIMYREYGCTDEDILRSSALMHGPVGAAIARERFGVTDTEVLNAIRFHTTGRPDMNALDLVVFVADAIEPNREDYPGLSEIRRLSKTSLELAALESLRRTREYVLRQGKAFNPQGEETIRALENRLRRGL